ncbi:MAG: RdgB/HAM1 family non-canonical purine NTP pyrophosphatase [Candidatus Kapaibacterium sp.]
MTILIATNNRHKVDEMLHILRRLDADLDKHTPADLPHGSVEVDETGCTLEENAYLKARAFFDHSGIPCIADDTGLEIDALDGRPGVRSARFAHDTATYAENVDLVLRQLGDRPGADRIARFRTVMCYVDAHRTIFAEGACAGRINEQPRGSHGFGYDPVFVPDGFDLTFAEMDPEVKNTLSHRSRALEHMRSLLASLWQETAATSAPPPSPSPVSMRRLLCRIAAAATAAHETELRRCLRHAQDHRLPMGAVYETLLQTYLFAGFPAALESLNVLHETEAGRDRSYAAVHDYDADDFRRRGTDTCKTIYTEVFEKMMARLSESSPDLASWMIVEGYGKVLSRAEMDVCTRELVNVAVLSVTGYERQLYSHLRGAMNMGAEVHEIDDAVEAAMGLAPAHVHRRSLDVWDAFRQRRGS